MKIFVGGPCPKKGLVGIYERVLVTVPAQIMPPCDVCCTLNQNINSNIINDIWMEVQFTWLYFFSLF